jgi:hypothetical protein
MTTTFNGPIQSLNGVVVPTYTSAQIAAITNPGVGLTVFNLDANALTTYNGLAWV